MSIMEEHADSFPENLQANLSGLATGALILIIIATLLAMILTVIVFWRGRGPAVPAAILFLLPLPLIVGVIALLAATIYAYIDLSYAVSVTSLEHGTSAAKLGVGFRAISQASSCFCPLALLSISLLMVLGFRSHKSGM